MKSPLLITLLSLAALTASLPAQADPRYGVGITVGNGPYHGGHHGYYHRRPYYRPYNYVGYYAPPPPVVVEKEIIYVQQPQPAQSIAYDEPQDNSRYCREYTRTVLVGGRQQQAYGTACLQPDGSWEMQD